MAYKKPQDPLTNNGFGIYPLTTADQVILSDGSRLEKNGAVNLVTLPTTEETPGEAPTINAGTFGGMTVSQFVEMIYPVGSIYMSASATSPETLFGGTWEQLKDRFLLGAGNSYTVGSTGGQSSVKLVKANIPPLALYYSGQSEPARPCISANVLYTGTKQNGYVDAVNTQNTNPTPVSTMPPYLAVYMWQRTA